MVDFALTTIMPQRGYSADRFAVPDGHPASGSESRDRRRNSGRTSARGARREYARTLSKRSVSVRCAVASPDTGQYEWSPLHRIWEMYVHDLGQYLDVYPNI